MNQIKVRIELQLEAGDKVTFQQAVAEALQDHVLQLAANDGAPEQAVVDVVRGKLAYAVEVKHGK